MTEEQLTKVILKWISLNDWETIAFDFPQSGTGVVFHPDAAVRGRTKSKGAFIPDIIAVRKEICVFFENKDRFVMDDFKKVESLVKHNIYTNAINAFLCSKKIKKIYYGVGLPLDPKYANKVINNNKMVDFVMQVDNIKNVMLTWDPNKIFY